MKTIIKKSSLKEEVSSKAPSPQLYNSGERHLKIGPLMKECFCKSEKTPEDQFHTDMSNSANSSQDIKC